MPPPARPPPPSTLLRAGSMWIAVCYGNVAVLEAPIHCTLCCKKCWATHQRQHHALQALLRPATLQAHAELDGELQLLRLRHAQSVAEIGELEKLLTQQREHMATEVGNWQRAAAQATVVAEEWQVGRAAVVRSAGWSSVCAHTLLYL